jgi:hypothetical protein
MAESQRLDEEFLRTLVQETAYILENTWELAFLQDALAEVVAFLVASIRLCPAGTVGEQVEAIKNFWNLTMQDVEEAVFEILNIHDEEISDTLEDDLYVLSLIFPSQK